MEEVLEGQMSIFDFIEPEIPEDISLEDLPEEEMVQTITDATGLVFRYVDSLFGYRSKKSDKVFYLKYSRYTCRDQKGHRFISVEWQKKNEGCGCPCDTLEKAINFIKNARDL